MGVFNADAGTQAGQLEVQHCVGGKGGGFTCSCKMGVFNADTGTGIMGDKGIDSHVLYSMRSLCCNVTGD